MADLAHDHELDMTAVAQAFGQGAVLAEPVMTSRGLQGRIWRVETDRGGFAVKELSTELTERDVRVDVEFQSVMVSRGVPAPLPLRAPSGDLLVTLGDRSFRAYSWVELQEPRQDLDPQTVGTLMAMLHREPLPAGPTESDSWYTDPVPAQDWQEAGERLAAAGAPFAAEFAASVPGFRSLEELFRRPSRTQLCHRDLWADNLRLTTAGEVCVIDWENCGPAEPEQELAMPLVEFCYRDVDRATRLYRAYRRAGGPGRLTDPSDFTMVLAQFGHFAISAAQWWLDTTDEASRARAEAWFREGWEAPLDRQQIEQVLNAVRGI